MHGEPAEVKEALPLVLQVPDAMIVRAPSRLEIGTNSGELS